MITAAVGFMISRLNALDNFVNLINGIAYSLVY